MSDEATCPVCAFGAGHQQRQISLASPREEILACLGTEPLAAPCPNCSIEFDVFERATFLGPTGPVANLDRGENAEPFTSRAVRFVEEVSAQARLRNSAVIESLDEERSQSPAVRIVRALSALHAGPPIAWCSREELAAMSVLAAEDAETSLLVHCTAMHVAVEAMNSPLDTPVILDQRVPWWAVESDGPDLAATEDELPGVWVLSFDLVASWAADRRGAELSEERRSRFSELAAGWVNSHPLVADGLGSPSFLQRALNASNVERSILTILTMNSDDASRVCRRFLEWGVIEDAEYLAQFAALLPYDETSSMLDGIMSDASIAVAQKLRIATGSGRIDAAEQLYLAEFGGLSGAAAAEAAWVIIEAFEQTGEYTRAYELLERFQEAIPESEWLAFAPPLQIELRNVIGNVRRRIDGDSAALNEYTKLIPILHGSGVRPSHRWTVMSNAAGCMSRLGQPRGAYRLLEGLMRSEELTAWETSRTMLEMGRISQTLGMWERASGFFLAASNQLRRESDSSGALLDALLALEGAYAALGHADKALQCATEAAILAKRSGNAVKELRALSQGLRAADSETSPSRAELKQWVGEIADSLEHDLLAGSVRPAERVAVAEAIAEARAEEAFEQRDASAFAAALESVGQLDSIQLTHLAELQLDDGDLESVEESLRKAWSLEIGTAVTDPDLDAVDVDTFRRSRGLRRVTAEHGMRLFERGLAVTPLLRAAELDGSLVSGYLSWPPTQRPEVGELLRNPLGLVGEDLLDHTAFVFAIYLGPRVFFVLLQDGREFVLCDLPGDELEEVRGEVAALTKRGKPRGEPLARAVRWQHFSQLLGAALQPRLTDGYRVVFLIGLSMDGLPMHLIEVGGSALLRQRECCFADSMLQLGGLSRRGDIQGREGRAAIVAVPRANEAPSGLDAFESAPSRWRQWLQPEYDEIDVLAGVDGTVGVVQEFMTRTDLMLLACHGIADAGSGLHALLLAAHDQCPPSVVGAATRGSDFLLSWQAIPSPTPRIVVSCACSSASSTVDISGERVSIDRVMLASATSLVIAPLWDVSVADGHALIETLLRNKFGPLDGPVSWVAAWVATVREVAESMPGATWQAFVPVGNWRET